MHKSSQIVAGITGCTTEQACAVVVALLKAGWTPPPTMEATPEGEAGSVPALSSLDDLPVGSVLTAHADGACSGNPGPGGWGVVYSANGAVLGKFSGAERHTTNNRMELVAVREAIRRAPVGVILEIVTDSKNVIGWLSQGWKRNNPEVAALCKEIDALLVQRKAAKGGVVRFTYVRGHSGDPLNDLADKLATDAIKMASAGAG